MPQTAQSTLNHWCKTFGINTSWLWYTEITFWKETGPTMQAQEKLDTGTCFLRCCLLSGAKPHKVPSISVSPKLTLTPPAPAVRSWGGSAFPRQWLQLVFLTERKCKWLPSATTCLGAPASSTHTNSRPHSPLATKAAVGRGSYCRALSISMSFFPP